jgi:hypothetical protein
LRASYFVIVALAGCAADPPGVSIKFDPCDHPTVAAPAGTAEQLASLDEALAMWTSVGAAGFSRDDTAPSVTIEFNDAADIYYGFYDETTATVYVNLRLDPQERTTVIAHELGHALGLFHVDKTIRESVMNTGNKTIVPNDGDAAALDELWGVCPPDP